MNGSANSDDQAGARSPTRNTLAKWRRRLVGRPSQAVAGRVEFATAWEGRPTPLGGREFADPIQRDLKQNRPQRLSRCGLLALDTRSGFYFCSPLAVGFGAISFRSSGSIC